MIPQPRCPRPALSWWRAQVKIPQLRLWCKMKFTIVQQASVSQLDASQGFHE